MIAIFLTKDEAHKFADKCHEFLLANCKGYSAQCWQEPKSNDKGTEYYVEVPQEYYKQYYKDSEKIIPFVNTEIKRASKLEPTLSSSFNAVEVTIAKD